jgi:hypothetical protein
VDFPIETEVDGHLGYVAPDMLPLSDDLVADLRAYQALWEQLPQPKDIDDEQPIDHEEEDEDEDEEDDEDDELEFEKVWNLIMQVKVAADSDVELARRLAEEVVTRTANLDDSGRQLLLPHMAAAVAGFDLHWAQVLVEDATTLTHGIDDPHDRARQIVNLVAAIAGFDPDQAETLALELSDPAYRDRAIMAAVEEMDRADRAESLAHRISHPRLRTWTLTRLADHTATPDLRDWTNDLLARLRAELGPDVTVRET